MTKKVQYPKRRETDEDAEIRISNMRERNLEQGHDQHGKLIKSAGQKIMSIFDMRKLRF